MEMAKSLEGIQIRQELDDKIHQLKENGNFGKFKFQFWDLPIERKQEIEDAGFDFVIEKYFIQESCKYIRDFLEYDYVLNVSGQYFLIRFYKSTGTPI
jgi:hypothetical protein